MVLSSQTIRRLGIIYPFYERTVHPRGTSYGLAQAGYDIRIAEHIRLWPGQFSLASSIEHFRMPDNVLGRCCDKSTLARLGLSVFNTVLEPGWRGYLTLELCNHSSTALIELQPGEPVAQVIFELIDEPVEQPYSGKYQDQPAEVVFAKFDCS